MNNNTNCQYHHAAPLRLELADALDSAKYRQTPREDRLDCLLRDSQDRHSITGVATAELTPSVWIKAGDAWTAHHLDNLIKAFPKVTQFPKEFPNPDHDFLQRIEYLSPKGTVHGCPEATACALGIHDNDSDNPSHHPELLWFRANIITPEQKTAASIPLDWHIPYLLDALDFSLAAELIREYPDLLIGHCNCTVPHLNRPATDRTRPMLHVDHARIPPRPMLTFHQGKNETVPPTNQKKNKMNGKMHELTDQQRTSLREKMLDDPKFITGNKQGLQLIDGNIVQMDDVITAITPHDPQDKFSFLSQWFREGTWMLSSSTQINRHPAARMILDMKQTAIPMVLDELTKHPHHWYGILKHLTGAQPVPPEHAGYMNEIRQDWLDWGQQNGYIQPESEGQANPPINQHQPGEGGKH